MKNKEFIKSSIKQNLPKLKKEFKIRDLKLFGSYVNNEETEKSDVDILVSFNEIIDLIQFIKLQNNLSDLLNTKVDLVMESALKNRIRKNILQKAELI
ncbi:MAG: nucleotidyltransferase family protein [Candidatus Cloacimonetes bacterium]|nr:nucleotidyltransferase family protein [Candidatus Cloacimonadota bacterium]